jgi:hypothetical protein
MSWDQRNWRRQPAPVSMLAAIPGLRCYQKDVDDGHLMVLAGQEPAGFHLSISHRTNTSPPLPGRYPSWDEICEARDRFTPAANIMVQLLPPREEWVNLHETCFHLWELLPCEHNGGAS